MKKSSPGNHQLQLPSAAEGIHIMEKLVDTICATYKVNEDNYGNILVAMTEAVNNAIYHGNKANPDKKVNITFESSPKTISFTVSDEGDGFDYTSIPDPTNPENLEKPTGRGIFLMHHLADKVSYSDNGRSVSLSFELSAN
jgi:serine/threonine-protein kinase RsbW